jgi:SNF2 family DNA or RNA helicase
MGCGKTVTGIGLDLDLRERHGRTGRYFRTLIICQKNGISIWKSHLLRLGVAGNRILAVDPGDRKEFADELAEGAHRYDYYIVHWDVLTKLEDLTLKHGRRPHIQWDHLIADEVHLAKNRKALRTKELKKIAAHVKTGLSGTPADDKPQDIWSVLQWLFPKVYTSYWKFFDKYLEWDDYTGYRRIIGVKNMREFHREIEPFYIRRELIDVRGSMPPKTYTQIDVKLTDRQRRDYDDMVEFQLSRVGSDEDELIAPVAIAVHQRLLQMGLGTITLDWSGFESGRDDGPRVKIGEPSPKIDALFEIIEANENESFIVWTNFLDVADMVEDRCIKKNIPVSKLTGKVTSQSARTAAVASFQAGLSRVFVGTIGAAGTSITLNKAHTSFFLDRHWNPSKNLQAEDRNYRIDNDDTPCQVIDIVALDTVDEKRIEKIGRKARWLRELLTM